MSLKSRFTHVLIDDDRVDRSSPDSLVLIRAISSDAHRNATCPAIRKLLENIVPHGRKKKKGEYKRWGNMTQMCYLPNTITMAH